MQFNKLPASSFGLFDCLSYNMEKLALKFLKILTFPVKGKWGSANPRVLKVL